MILWNDAIERSTIFITVDDEMLKYIIIENFTSYVCRPKHYRVMSTPVF